MRFQTTIDKYRIFLRFVAGSLCFSLFSNVSFADTDLEVARRLLSEGRAEQSVALLKESLQTFAGSEQYDYLLGLALFQAGQGGEAIFAFERVLMSNPNNVDARLKAVHISIERGNFAYANELIQPLSNQNLTDAQQKEKDLILSTLDKNLAGSSFSLRGYLLGGVGSNDNVTSGPNQSALIIPALSMAMPPLPPQPVQLGTAQRVRDTVRMVEAGLSLQKTIGQDSWLMSDANVHQNFNSNRTDVNSGYSTLNLGGVTRSGQEYFGASLSGQTYQVANVTYRNSYGPRLYWTHVFNDRRSMTGYLQQLAFYYPGNAINNTTRQIGGITIQSAMGEGGVFQAGLYSGREVAHDVTKPHFGFSVRGASLGGWFVYSNDLSLLASVNYESRRHSALDALYLITRHDVLMVAGASVDYKFGKGWHFLPGYSYTRNVSNTQLYEYIGNSYNVQLRWDFGNENN
jgi:tetratricopeptide (TPR) repeat protein